MEKSDEMIARLSVKSTELKSDTIQDLLLQAQKAKNVAENQKYWQVILEKLWNYLETGLESFDDQLLCSTCFYAVLKIVDDQEVYLDRILAISIVQLNLSDNRKTSFLISLMYGLFQSAFLIKEPKNLDVTGIILMNVFDKLIILGYSYSWYTFIVFKIINAFKKVIGTGLQSCVFSKENQIKLLNLINHNWENPITGVRDSSKTIFQTLILILDKPVHDALVEEIEGFHWNKAKYLMLSEVIQQSRADILSINPKWIEGMVHSLYKPGLVSAGADMYYAVINKLKSGRDWCVLFKPGVLKVLDGSTPKAIENFSNYWCLATLKRYPTVMEHLLEDLIEEPFSQRTMYSILCLLKQGNKLGIVRKAWHMCHETTRIIAIGLENSNVQVRMLAFDIICVIHGKNYPDLKEYKFVYDFIENNVSSDSTVLRQSMLGSLKVFFTKIHTVFLNTNKDSVRVELDEFLVDFLVKLQKFLKKSLELKGNYQRKITTIMLCELMFEYLSEVPKKKRQPAKSTELNLINQLKAGSYWILSQKAILNKLISLLRDPADDVRDNAANILLKFYSEELEKPDTFNQIIEDALKCAQSKFFYEISSGQCIIKLIANLLLKKRNKTAKFKTIEDIFTFGLTELVAEFKQKRDIMQSIEMGKQLHSFISILHATIEVAHQKSYKIKNIKDSTVAELLETLQGISNQFSSEGEASVSSDFSRMNEMVQEEIAISGLAVQDQDETKISGLHQIVLNCLWLNVKSSCELSSLIVRYYSDPNKMDIPEKCLGVMTHVLETSRHKGAIEAAGASLGQAIQHLTSQPKDSNLTQLPMILLKKKLNELISEAGKMASVTRRGAGLSIMVHRIVSSDVKKGKPLFHYFIQTLLENCNKIDDDPTGGSNSEIDNEKDLPKAIYIHFLTRIVIDSSLASESMYYSAELAQLAFTNLTSDRWQIRNAALQLYGALVPKLIGQRKSSGAGEETIATVACDEFKMHSPKLWKYILEQLQFKATKDTIQDHSNLVPILNIFANIAKRYNFSSDIKKQKSEYDQLFKSLVRLLGSPIYTVRRLTAGSIYNLFTFDKVFDWLKKQEFKSENQLHGSLLVTAIYHKAGDIQDKELDHIKMLYDQRLKKNHSYVSRTVYDEVFLTISPTHDEDFTTAFEEVRNNRYKPGVNFWINSRIQKFINITPWADIPKLLPKIVSKELGLAGTDIEQYCGYLHEKLQAYPLVPPVHVLQSISEILLKCDRKFSNHYIWKILYEISSKLIFNDKPLLKIIRHLEKNQYHVSYKIRYIIPFLAKVLIFVEENDRIVCKLAKLVLTLTDPEKVDSDMRFIAALATNEMSLAFRRAHDVIKSLLLKSAVILLQDEDEDIRNVVVQFYKTVNHETVLVHPFLCLKKILDHDFLSIAMNEPTSVKLFCRELSLTIQSMGKVENSDAYNPFSNDSKNIYIEVQVITELVDELRKHYPCYIPET